MSADDRDEPDGDRDGGDAHRPADAGADEHGRAGDERDRVGRVAGRDRRRRSSRRARRRAARGRRRPWRCATAAKRERDAGDERDGLDPAPPGDAPRSRWRARASAIDAASEPRSVTTLATLDRAGPCAAGRRGRRASGRSAARRAASTTSPSRKNENVPTASSASSVVSSRPRLPGVRRPAPKRAVKSATAAAGRPTSRHAGPATRTTRRQPGRSSRSSSHVADPPARLRVAPQLDQRDDRRDHDDERAEREQPARDVGREPVDRAPEDVAEHAERGRPRRRRRARRRAGSAAAASATAPAMNGASARTKPMKRPTGSSRRRGCSKKPSTWSQPLLGDLQPLAVAQQPRRGRACGPSV